MMNTSKRPVQVMERPVTQVTTLMGLETQRLVKLADLLGWDATVLGQAPLPDAPVRLGEWLIIPAEQDTSVIPERAFKRVQALYAAGLRPKGFVLVHEAPALLAAPAVAERPAGWRSWFPSQKGVAGMAVAAGGALAASAVVGALAVVAISAVVALALPMVALIGVAALDPVLIAVTEEDFWIEIDRWDLPAR
jgi:hypothetical protein